MSDIQTTGYRLSPEQIRLWPFIDAGNVLNTQISCDFTTAGQKTGIAELESALQQLVGRYEVLRTVFHAPKELKYPVQRVLKEQDVTVKVADIQNKDPQQYCEAELSAGFDHQAGPLIRAAVISGERDHRKLVFTASSMILDAQSMAVFLSELELLLKGESLEEELLQFPQIAEWQHSLLEEQEPDVTAFWSAHEGRYTLNRGFTFRSGENNPERSPRLFTGNLTPEQDRRLSEVSKQLDVQKDRLLAAHFIRFISRYGSAETVDAAVIDPVRGFDELASLVGNLSQSVPSVFDVSNGPETLPVNAAYLEQLQDHALYFNPESKRSSEKLPDAYDLEIHLSIKLPVYSLFENILPVSARGASALHFGILECDGNLSLMLMINSKAVEPFWGEEWINRFSRYLDLSLEQKENNNPLQSWLRADEQRRLADSMNPETVPEHPEMVTTHIETAMERYPHRLAVLHGNRRITYRQLDNRSTALAGELMRRGIGKGDFVGILLPRGIDAIVSILGILRAGAAYIPVDTEYPASRIGMMTEDSGMKLLITSRRIGSGTDFSVPCLYNDDPGFGETPSDFSLPEIVEDDSAYVIYTSGSTGKPKGCVISHGELSWYIAWVKQSYLDGYDAVDIPLFTSLAFDLTVTSVFGSLACGMTLTVYDETRSIEEVLKEIFDPAGNVRVLKLTPAHTMMLPYTGLTTTGVERVIIGGEALLPKHVKILRDLNPGIKIYNEYGPTETVVGCSVDVITAGKESITIGRPIDHTRLYVLNDEKEVLPAGVAGEIAIGGKSVSRGYWNRPELTAERFVKIENLDDRVYLSGDIGYWNPDGTLNFLGRRDHQVKIRGYRIELDEIRIQLMKHELVEDAFVIHREKSSQLIAYIVSESTEDESSFRNFLMKELPEYMVPDLFIMADSIPLTVNGKVDISGLPDPDHSQVRKKKEVKAPVTPLQYDLFQIWSDILETVDFSTDDDFFELGGHSLKAMQIVSRVQRSLGINLLLSDFFDHLTVESLAEHLTKIRNASETALKALKPAEFYPCSNAQRRLWVLDQFPESRGAYFISEVFSLTGKLDVSRFTSAFEKLVERHESLRTSFHEVDDEACQKIHDSVTPDFEYLDLSGKKGLEGQWSALKADILHTPFDLSKPSLIRSVLVRAGDEEYRWVICMHHIISDGWSIGVLMKEVLESYRKKETGRVSTRGDVPEIQYKEFANWQKEQAEKGEIIKSEAYWLKRFSSPPVPVTLPFQKKRPALKTYNGSLFTGSLKGNRYDSFKKLSGAGTSRFMSLLATLGAALHVLNGEQEFVFGTPVAGRSLPEWESIIGFFVNLVPLKISPGATATFDDLLKESSRVVMEALTHQQVPFDSWTEKLDHDADPSRSRLFDILIVLQNMDQVEWNLDGVQVKTVKQEEHYSKFDLVFEFEESDDELLCRINYNTDLFPDISIHELWDHFLTILDQVSANREIGITELEAGTFTSVTGSSGDMPAVTANDNSESQTAAGTAKTEDEPELESLVTGIWESVLDVEGIRPDDNFFALGGDSIKAIQITSGLRKSGYGVQVNALFHYPDLQRFISQIGLVKENEGQNNVTGTWSPTPIQSSLFDRGTVVQKSFYQTALFDLDPAIPARIIRRALTKLVNHHDLLRSVFKEENGEYRGEVTESTDSVILESVTIEAPEVEGSPAGGSGDKAGNNGDTNGMATDGGGNETISEGNSAGDLETTLVSLLENWMDETDISTGPLYRAALIESPSGELRSLFLAIHHLVIDTVSWRILIEDLEALAEQAMPVNTTSERSGTLQSGTNQPAVNQPDGVQPLKKQAVPRTRFDLPAKTSSFVTWANHLASGDQVTEAEKMSRPFWESFAGSVSRSNAFLEKEENPQVITAERVLPAGVTEDLLRKVHHAYRTDVQDLLLTAFSRAVYHIFSKQKLVIALESHGRPASKEFVTDRTIGWFTSEYPALLQYHSGPGEHICEIKEHRRKLTPHTDHFSRLTGSDREAYSGLVENAFGFNYLGDITVDDQDSLITFNDKAPKVASLIEQRTQTGKPGSVLICIDNRELIIKVTCSTGEPRAAEILADALAEELLGLIDHCKNRSESSFTPSDFDYEGLDMENLDNLLKNI